MTDTQHTFQAGDRVVFTSWDGPAPLDDEPGTVIDINKRGSVIVKWDDDTALLAFLPEELELLRRTPTTGHESP